MNGLKYLLLFILLSLPLAVSAQKDTFGQVKLSFGVSLEQPVNSQGTSYLRTGWDMHVSADIYFSRLVDLTIKGVYKNIPYYSGNLLRHLYPNAHLGRLSGEISPWEIYSINAGIQLKAIAKSSQRLLFEVYAGPGVLTSTSGRMRVTNSYYGRQDFLFREEISSDRSGLSVGLGLKEEISLGGLGVVGFGFSYSYFGHSNIYYSEYHTDWDGNAGKTVIESSGREWVNYTLLGAYVSVGLIIL